MPHILPICGNIRNLESELNKEKKMKLEFSAGGLIYRQDNISKLKFALILDPFKKWTFPKGKIEKGEKPDEAAKREITEEIGLKDLKLIAKLDKIGYWFKEPWKDKNELIHKYVYFYLFESAQGELKHQTAEIKDAKWFTTEEIKKLKTYKDTLPLLQKALKLLKNKKL